MGTVLENQLSRATSLLSCRQLHMPRFARSCPSGSLQHVISRFVNREFRLLTERDRANYLARLGAALPGADWRPIAHGLMSSHVHLAFVAGEAEPSTWMKPVHTGVAQDLNRTQGRLGPVFA